MGDIVAACLHHLALLVMTGALCAEFVLLRQDDIRAHVGTLSRIDVVYILSALVLLLAGLSRLVWFGKGMAFYQQTPYFHVKMMLFVLIGVLSIPPTMRYVRWRRAAVAGTLAITPAEHRSTRRLVLAELHLLLLMPLFAVLMARGY
ncbi:MAG: DUF2214 family protein [Actinomycetota bacterium]|nr:DUF2214 family protein [Actinomycetota bacterium]